jgi:pimeloyl-ACP methyl ester carboxylesterase
VVASAPPPEFERAASDNAFPFRMIAGLARYAPWVMRFVLNDQRRMAAASPGRQLERTRSGVGASDAAFLADETGGALFAASMRLAYRQGVEGSLLEHRLYRSAWGFSLGEIQTPAAFFIGEDDVLASRNVNQMIADALPHASLHVVPDAGHLSLIPSHPEMIVAAIAPDTR